MDHQPHRLEEFADASTIVPGIKALLVLAVSHLALTTKRGNNLPCWIEPAWRDIRREPIMARDRELAAFSFLITPASFPR